MRFLAVSIGKIGGGEGSGALNKAASSNPAGAADAIVDGVSSIIGLLTIVAAIWFLIQFILGGFSWISAGGDKNKISEAQGKLSSAIIGLTVVVAGWAILALAGQFFGWTDILNPANVLKNLKFGG